MDIEIPPEWSLDYFRPGTVAPVTLSVVNETTSGESIAVNGSLASRTITSPFVEDFAAEGSFRHVVTLNSDQPFSMRTVTVTGGSFQGRQVILIERAAFFPFEKLPPELRNKVYKYSLVYDDYISIWMKTKKRVQGTMNLKSTGLDCSSPLALLQVNRETREEASSLFYSMNVFKLTTTTALLRFLTCIGPSRRFLSNIYLKDRDGYRASTAPRAFRLLADARHLKQLYFGPKTNMFGRCYNLSTAVKIHKNCKRLIAATKRTRGEHAEPGGVIVFADSNSVETRKLLAVARTGVVIEDGDVGAAGTSSANATV
ncbi:hypothetical protein B0A49_00471 [Cryomyces minteri]|uniref:2EXR domain-containing protein n=1 Tax=Cryomyces minteri TaxID=331657 RepID=A0A4U0XZT0_9PEZI|nr:hypothetical protein B0A49_00471 [Cryomyces minteri]